MKAGVVGAAGLSVVLGASFVVGRGDNGDSLIPVDSAAATISASTAPDTIADEHDQCSTHHRVDTDRNRDNNDPSDHHTSDRHTSDHHTSDHHRRRALAIAQADWSSRYFGEPTAVPAFLDWDEFGGTINEITGWHGRGHEILGALRTEGVVSGGTMRNACGVPRDEVDRIASAPAASHRR